MRHGPSSVEAYLAGIENAAFRASLERLRSVIKHEAPDAEEVISYGIPTFKLNGMLGSYAAFKDHCSFFPGAIVEDFKEELRGFRTSKGTIQFTPEHELPERLVRAMIRMRIEQNAAKKKRKP